MARSKIQHLKQQVAYVYFAVMIMKVKKRCGHLSKYGYLYLVNTFSLSFLFVLKGATSHHLGQNFSKMIEIVFEDPDTAVSLLRQLILSPFSFCLHNITFPDFYNTHCTTLKKMIC